MVPSAPSEGMAARADIIDLRKLLAGRFPRLRTDAETRRHPAALATGVPGFDDVLGGGLAPGAITELVGAGPGSGSAQVIHALLRQAAAAGRFLALVDGADSFEADAAPEACLPRLLWVRCRQAQEALAAADLLVRDRNFPLVVLDLKASPADQLRRLPGNVWHRFGRLLEQHQSTLLVITPQPMVSGVPWRVRVEGRLDLACLLEAQARLAERLRFTVLRQAATVAEPALTLAG
jgi:hypothetical protein